MSEKAPRPEILNASDNKELVNSIIDFLIKNRGGDKSKWLAEIANEVERIGEERKQLAIERGLPEDATWDEIIAHDERQGKN